MIEQGVVDLGGGGGIGEGWKRGASLPRDSLFTVHIKSGMAEARRELVWAALVALMAVK